jgi:hypothetical protein
MYLIYILKCFPETKVPKENIYKTRENLPNLVTLFKAHIKLF